MGTAEARGRQEAHARVDDAVRAMKIERRIVGGQGEVCLVIRFDRAKVFPVTVEQVGLDVPRCQAAREHFLAEIRRQRLFRQDINKHLPLEQINAHAGQILAAFRLNAEPVNPFRRGADGGQLLGRFRFLDEANYPAGIVQSHDAESGCLIFRHRQDGDGNIGVGFAVRLDQISKIHAIELVAGEDQHFLATILLHVADLLANGVGGALIPAGAFGGLLGCQDFDEAVAERVELVGVRNVPVQADAEELSEDVNAVAGRC